VARAPPAAEAAVLPLPEATPALAGHGLGRCIEGRWLFRDLALELPAGATLWVRGPSGAGKTQLLRRLARLVDGPGTLHLQGRAATAIDVRTWRAEVTYVGQRPPLADGGAGSGHDLRQRVASLGVQAARDATDPVPLAQRWGLPPARWEQPLSTLSGGELQRLWLAVALSRRPTVLLLDEPTASLDEEATRTVEASLAQRTVILTTHDEAQGARIADRQLSLGR